RWSPRLGKQDTYASELSQASPQPEDESGETASQKRALERLEPSSLETYMSGS
ncbi:MAG: hypothetical protein GY749_08610, partial [Desulfobacteraceae bacterium]|nr:hypothetical protein [Desulfobacteraceae bacterium]